jgi:hypothetical protein
VQETILVHCGVLFVASIRFTIEIYAWVLGGVLTLLVGIIAEGMVRDPS